MIERVLATTLLFLIGASPAAAQEPIRVGFLTILTGALASPGKEMENGIRLFLEEYNNALSGRPVELTEIGRAHV